MIVTGEFGFCAGLGLWRGLRRLRRYGGSASKLDVWSRSLFDARG